uniref:Uncharacterized protein n=1 Tax=Chenopodium quinoa TaxID=63459 RepID=A0A803L9S6_CHEQI
MGTKTATSSLALLLVFSLLLTISSAFEDSNEYAMSSEVSRRSLLDVGTFISYLVLDRNRVPCSKAGESYYNCLFNNETETANPYERNCQEITRCQRS